MVATRNGRMELSTIRPVSGRAQRDVAFTGTALRHERSIAVVKTFFIFGLRS
jgi:hypothetical protein